jgi:hypothetical protein
MAYRILLLESVRDDGAARRQLLLSKTPSLREHQFDIMYATEGQALDDTMPLPRRVVKSQESLDERDLLHRITERVEDCQPDILIVHSGALFQSYPDQMMLVLRALKAGHPELRIGFRPRPFEHYGPQSFFEYTLEMQRLMEQMFADEPRRN